MQVYLFWAHVAATFYMVGLVSFVHGVHYPMFADVPRDAFVAFEAAHLRRSGPVIIPFMLLEAISGALLIASLPDMIKRPKFFLASLLALAFVWAVTFAWSVPMHARLESGFDSQAHASLLWSNLARTLLWGLRGVLLILAVA